MKFSLYAFTACVLISTSPVSAAKYVVQASGTVERIATVDNGVVNLNPVLINNLTNAGDRISFSFEIDTSDATLTSLYDTDPTINIYYFTPKNIALSMGGYDYKPSRISPTGSSLQLWNGYSSGSNTVDSQSFNVFDYPFSENKDAYPFQIGSGSIAESIGLNLFDFTASARSSDLISEIADPSRFGSKSFSYGLLNSTTNLFYNVTSSNLVVSISPVPEPATWAMMLVGFGMIGATARYRRRAMKIAYA